MARGLERYDGATLAIGGDRGASPTRSGTVDHVCSGGSLCPCLLSAGQQQGHQEKRSRGSTREGEALRSHVHGLGCFAVIMAERRDGANNSHAAPALGLHLWRSRQRQRAVRPPCGRNTARHRDRCHRFQGRGRMRSPSSLRARPPEVAKRSLDSLGTGFWLDPARERTGDGTKGTRSKQTNGSYDARRSSTTGRCGRFWYRLTTS